MNSLHPAGYSRIVLLTDFGNHDYFVGVLKGVIRQSNRAVEIIDLTHLVPAQGIRAAAFLLKVSYRYFPGHTLFLAVVDPGVGSGRRIVFLEGKDYAFLGPDNGIFSWLDKKIVERAFVCTSKKYYLANPSHTFQARDILAPLAAQLARGFSPANLGQMIKQTDLITFPFPRLYRQRAGLKGEVIYSDHFGNLITNFPNQLLARKGKDGKFTVGDKSVQYIGRFYAEVPQGTAVAMPGSTGYIEIAINRGSAADVFAAGSGSPVIFRKRR